MALMAREYQPGDYGVKLLISAVVEVDGCFGAEIEGYVLSHPDAPEIMDVTLIKEAPHDPINFTHIGKDQPGPSLNRMFNEHDPDREFFYRHLMREARSSRVICMLEDAWCNWKAWADIDAAADAAYARGHAA